MHEPVQSRIEHYLSRSLPEAERTLVETHLAECPPCQEEVIAFREINELLGTLKPSELEARPNFYAKVMEKVEAESSNSFWNLFLVPGFGRGLAYAATALVALTATYWFSQPRDPEEILASIQVPAPIYQSNTVSAQPSRSDELPSAHSAGLQSTGFADGSDVPLAMDDPSAELILVDLGTFSEVADD
jgi:anti-sigma factor RsiW